MHWVSVRLAIAFMYTLREVWISVATALLLLKNPDVLSSCVVCAVKALRVYCIVYGGALFMTYLSVYVLRPGHMFFSLVLEPRPDA